MCCFVLIVFGGFFCGCDCVFLVDVSVVEVMKYFIWNMGWVIIINLLILVNKGLELFEVVLFYDVDFDDIIVVVYF